MITTFLIFLLSTRLDESTSPFDDVIMFVHFSSGQFHQRLYAKLLRPRSQTRKKLLELTVSFMILGSACVKAACKMLVKLTQGERKRVIWKKNARSKAKQTKAQDISWPVKDWAMSRERTDRLRLEGKNVCRSPKLYPRQHGVNAIKLKKSLRNYRKESFCVISLTV